MDEQVLRDDEARVNVTYNGQNGDLPDAVSFDAGDADIRMWVTEALQAGTIPGLRANGNVDFSDFVVDRFARTEARPWNLIQLRPKTPFGA